VTPRDLHPAAWWMWALGLAAAASSTINPFLLVLIVLAACLMVVARRTEAPWALSFRLYLYLAGLIVVIRVLFRVVFGGFDDTVVLVHLPRIPLPDVAAGIQLLGPVTRYDVLSGLYDGLRLAAIVLCVGAANTLANPKRLLKSLPPALYEAGTAVIVALSLFPQLAESVRRVRRARHLRGDPGRGVGALRRIVVPVMEDALDRSLFLAAGMDARGYGRSGVATARARRLTGALLLAGLMGLCIGVYALLDHTAPRALAWPFIGLGVLLAVGGFASAGRRVERTRYRPDRWRGAELLTAGCGIAAAALVMTADLDIAYPGFDVVPQLSVPVLLAVMIGIVPALATPPPLLDAAGSTAEAPR